MQRNAADKAFFNSPVRESVTLILNELMPVTGPQRVENGSWKKAGMSTGRHTAPA